MSHRDVQETPKGGTKSLKTIQRSASDRENLVGRPAKSLKHHISQEIGVDSVVTQKTFLTKETQTNFDTKVTVDDLTNPDGASEKYWQILAEKRQVALQDALSENKKLHELIEELKQENALYKQMLDEANSFVEVIKEELASCSKDDTGIDVNDVSTADETTEEIVKTDATTAATDNLEHN